VLQGNLTGNLTENKLEQILQEMYNENKQLVGKADNFFVVDKNGIIRLVASDKEYQRSFVGADISLKNYANQTKVTQKPVFSNGLV
jgi:C4-dicarboxylate-specific signal transduction histidine kinase